MTPDIVTPDLGRLGRCGIPEVIYGGSKTAEDLAAIAKRFLESQGRAIATKVDKEKASHVKKALKGKDTTLSYDERAQVLIAKKKTYTQESLGTIGLVTAGTSDIPVGEEVRIVATELGCEVVYDYDVGVAGIHRVYPVLEEMKKRNVAAIVAVAGMEGALPSVIAGLVSVPVIGVPTSVGYGTSQKGLTALYAMLNACAPVACVNIDNGYGAAVIASHIARKNHE